VSPSALEWRAVNPYYRKREQHGHLACYSAGCRCDECRQAASEARQRNRLKAKSRNQPSEPSPIQDPVDETAEANIRTEGHDPLDWAKDAACRGMDSDLFFPEKGGTAPRLLDKARATCAICTVVDDCLAYAMNNKERHGFWGGLSERQRRRLESGSPEKVKATADAMRLHSQRRIENALSVERTL